MLSTQATQLESAYHQVRVGGDSAMLKGIMKALFEADDADQAAGGIGLLDYTFSAAHALGIDDLRADIHATAWERTVERSRLRSEELQVGNTSRSWCRYRRAL